MAAEAIALIPTIAKIVEKVLDVVSKPKQKPLGYLSGKEVEKVRGQLDETKKNIESVRSGLYQAGKQILDYQELYSASMRANAICEQLLNLLSGYATSKKKKRELPDEIGECLSKLYESLEDSLADMNAHVKPKQLTDEDYKTLSKTMVALTAEQGTVKSALKDKEYGTARDSLRRIDTALKQANKDIRDSVYSISLSAVDKLKT